MQNQNKITLPFDIKAEVFIHQMMETYGLNLGDIDIIYKGWSNRGFEKDIANYRIRSKKLSLHLNRAALIDTLPPVLFGRKGQTENQAKRASTESFFYSMDKLLFTTQLSLEDKAMSIEATTLAQLVQFWGLHELPKEMAHRLVYVFPFSQTIMGNWTLTAHCFSLVLARKVQISRLKNLKKIKVPEALQWSSEGAMSGIETTTGDWMQDYTPTIEVKVKTASKAEQQHFLPHGSQHQVIEKLFDFFLPFEVEARLSIDIHVP